MFDVDFLRLLPRLQPAAQRAAPRTNGELTPGDLLSEIYIALRRRTDIANDDHAVGYAHLKARSIADRARQRHLSATLLDDDILPDPHTNTEAQALSRLTITTLANRLKPRQRQMLHLLAEGHTPAEVARRLGVSRAAVTQFRQSLAAKLEHNDV